MKQFGERELPTFQPKLRMSWTEKIIIIGRHCLTKADNLIKTTTQIDIK
jgi:hypothetical protein